MHTIENKTNRRVLLRFNSTRTMYLAPRATCEVEPVEVKGKGSDVSEFNAWITHLVDKHVVAVKRTEKKKATKARGTEKATKAPGAAKATKAPGAAKTTKTSKTSSAAKKS